MNLKCPICMNKLKEDLGYGILHCSNCVYEISVERIQSLLELKNLNINQRIKAELIEVAHYQERKYDTMTFKIPTETVTPEQLGDVFVVIVPEKQFYGVKTTICKAKSFQRCSKFYPDQKTFGCKYWVSHECHYKD